MQKDLIEDLILLDEPPIPWLSIKETNPSIKYLEDIEKLQDYVERNILDTLKITFQIESNTAQTSRQEINNSKSFENSPASFKRLLREMWSPTLIWCLPRRRQSYQTVKGIRW